MFRASVLWVLLKDASWFALWGLCLAILVLVSSLDLGFLRLVIRADCLRVLVTGALWMFVFVALGAVGLLIVLSIYFNAMVCLLAVG